MHFVKLLLVSALVLALPVLMGSQSVVELGEHGAAIAKNTDKGNSGKGNSGKSGNKGKSSRDKSGKEKASKSSRASNGQAKTKGNAKKSSGGNGPLAAMKNFRNSLRKDKGAVRKAKKTKTVHYRPAKSPRPKAKGAALASAATGEALASELKSLNSLNRNVNGLMNSSDPKMEPFREFVVASADHEKALEDLLLADDALATTQMRYDDHVNDLGLSEDPAMAEQELIDRANELLANEPAPDDPAREAWVEEMAELNDAMKTLDQLETDAMAVENATKLVDDTKDAASEEAMTQAMVDSLNATGAGSVGPEDITPEMEDWVAGQLGVGDETGLIDDYIVLATNDEVSTPEENEPLPVPVTE